MEKQTNTLRLHHRGRVFQLPIYFGKMLRSFIYLSDWKMLPMAAIIAALVSMVVRKDFFITMEGSLKGAFSLTCVAIWNGCFNSIQVICRERPIIKREHRSGMHIFSYVFSHCLYQGLLCLGQTIVTLVVLKMAGIQFIEKGVITGIGILDIGITTFLLTYASDMISLFVSSLAHTTTSAMTVMPFVLIFQLIFSGGIFNMPAWTESIAQFTISHYGLNCITAQSNYNELPMVTGWNYVVKLEDKEIKGSVTLGQIMDLVTDNGIFDELRSSVLVDDETLLKALGSIANADISEGAPTEESSATVQMAYDAAQSIQQLAKLASEKGGLTLGDLVDTIANTSWVESLRDTPIPYDFTVGELINSYGSDKLEAAVKKANAAAMVADKYNNTAENVTSCWLAIGVQCIIFALLSMISLKFIDKDKR